MHRPRHTDLAKGRARRLRNSLTVSEARLWSQIRARQLGVRFRRQVPIGAWIVDFACLEHKLVVEVDDKSHDYRDETNRTAHIESLGFRILRFTNREVAQELEVVVWTIEQSIGASA